MTLKISRDDFHVELRQGTLGHFDVFGKGSVVALRLTES